MKKTGIPASLLAPVVLLAFAVSACSSSLIPQAPILLSSPAPPTATPFAPDPPTPTYLPTPFPTDTPLLTSTPLATATPLPTLAPDPEITLLFTGVIVPARCVQAAIDNRGEADYIFAEVAEIIRSADLAIGTLNATLSDSQPPVGCIQTYVLVGDSRSAAAMGAAGFDLMSVATNHIKNCSNWKTCDQAFFDTLDNLRKNNIQPIGAGSNHAEAMLPVVVEVSGVRFGFVSLGMVEPMAFAGEDTHGIAVLNEENLRAAITAAREISDVVIAMPHWGPEDSPNPNSWQLDYARAAVEAGADLVVGNHTHVVQAIEEIDGIPVFYGLGNFVFDQNWARDHQQGVILRVTFRGTELQGYELIPTHVDFDGTVHTALEEEAQEILDRIQAASSRLPRR